MNFKVSFDNSEKCKKVANAITAIKGVPLFYCGDAEKSMSIAETLYHAGFKVIEFTNRGENALSVFSAICSKLKNRYSDIYIGAGTIIDDYDAKPFIKAGADFIMGPNLSEDTASLALKNDVLYIPGIMTVTEAVKAMKCGCRILKLFPGEVLTPNFIKAVKAPLPDLSFIVTGGVKPTSESIDSWIDAGAAALGFGSQLISREIIDNCNYSALKENSEKLVRLLNGNRS
ncbi:MAG TPA: bifunctional 4-hydroxy-2-oxoglutarate aldolase/2-dehydro-3-deoxy-phosphogluconate aldolase [Spirochaetota bacterium]|nr:bifunctional 4-hydroxy-2-oxoglutarate aldolase/2-dehydro-3-deoxy-phosphogluconate aldolase [Spirochaetota bacterium]HQE58728.1 bifunctional 4-hydroxy-2-oxoglutarate aldolase/2-dehydro-3-deoxy-phosphogluconate aldolase [Spirochaetota bacterium]